MVDVHNTVWLKFRFWIEILSTVVLFLLSLLVLWYILSIL